LLDHRRFRAAYDFMVLRAETGQIEPDVASFWTDAQTQTAEERAVSFQLTAQPENKRRPRARRRRRKPQSS
jgi:poly(A) polymerase